MRAAIYARYSSDSQSEKSIDDQVRVCKAYCSQHNITLDDKHIFIDQAVSGALINRPGLLSMDNAIEAKEIDAVVVDDLSRLSRSNHQMLTLVLKFNFHQIKLISVSDGIITDDENAKIGIQMRGLINELYLDDLRKKTLRGLEGQKLRGFSAGEHVYGYYSKPQGELKLDKRGVAKYDGKIHVINPEEATIVKRIYQEFISGKSIHRIAIGLNEDKIATKRGWKNGWNTSTLSRILKNERYAGNWTWRMSKTVRDPLTGKKKKYLRPVKEHLPFFREDLIIIDKSTWDKAQERWKDLAGSWPVSKKRNSFYKQKSYVHTSPTHLFSGLMRCSLCGGVIALISGKSCGYYGCLNGKRKICKNTLLVSRKKVEEIILNELKNRLLTTENLIYVYNQVEKIAKQLLNTTPDDLINKRALINKLSTEINNYLNFIKTGNFSKSVAEALTEAERKENELTEEIKALEFQTNNTFKVPPREWIDQRLKDLSNTLEQGTVTSSQALKELLGEIKLEPMLTKENDNYFLYDGLDKDFRPYYVAHTNIETLALLDKENQGSNWKHWWAVKDSNLRSASATDLQSVPVDHLGNCPYKATNQAG